MDRDPHLGPDDRARRDGPRDDERRQELAHDGPVPLACTPRPEGGAVQGPEHEQQRARAVPDRRPPGEIGSAIGPAPRSRAPRGADEPRVAQAESDTSSQVVVLGEVRADLASVPAGAQRAALASRDALRALVGENDVVVIEGWLARRDQPARE